MDIRKLQRAIVDGLEEVKGQNIVVFNTEHLSPLFERVIIASGTSNRQTRALAASVRDAVKSRGFGLSRTEGEDNGEWIIVDCGAAVVHLMQPGIRDYYHLEEIWGDKPVRLKLDGAPARLVKAQSDARDAAAVAAKPKAKAGTARTKVRAGTTTGKSTPTRSRSAAGRSTAADEPATKATVKRGARPVAAPRKGVARSTGVKQRATSAAAAPPAASSRRSAAVATPTKAVRRKA